MNLKKFKWVRWVVIILAGYVTYSWMSGSSGIVNQVNLYRTNKALLNQLDSLNLVKTELDWERVRLRSDTLYLEKVVRAELGMAKKGEKLYRLYDGKVPQKK